MTGQEAKAKLLERDATKLKGTFKALRESDEQDYVEIAMSTLRWMREAKENLFLTLGKELHKWAEAVRGDPREIWEIIASEIIPITEKEEIEQDMQQQRIIKRLITTAQDHGVQVHLIWSRIFEERKKKVGPIISRWATEWTRKGIFQQKQEWERFMMAYAQPNVTTTCSTTQTTDINIGEAKPREAAERIIVWNGNGMRARWTEKSELREITRATNPDVICFLEAKINSEKLFQLKGFEEWVTQSGFSNIYCYWSAQADNKSHGNEGIVVMSKVKPVRVRYGMGSAEFDKQARVMSIEFKDWISIFTYNPQGGFTKDSLGYRSRWEDTFKKYLIQMTKVAKRARKQLIWAGDLNVNPTRADWSTRAFDRIRHKIPRDVKPAGCREEDQEKYREMIREMNGVNVAERFNKESQRTCFPDEYHLEKNFGQRIDHIIAERTLFDGTSPIQVESYDVLQQFGGGRRGGSDHCPMLIKLQRASTRQLENSSKSEAQSLDGTTLQVMQILAEERIEIADEGAPMSDAFRECDSEEEESDGELTDSDDEEAMMAEQEDETEQTLFEDVPMPVLKCEVATGENNRRSVRMLIDSGSSLDLVSKNMADELQKTGIKQVQTSPVNITVANGRKNAISTAMDLSIVIEDRKFESRKFLILPDLPYDMILGHSTCVRWQARLDWRAAKLSLKLPASESRVEVSWRKIHKTQHWKKPATMLLAEDTEIPPDYQVVVPVCQTRSCESWKDAKGLVTPVRSKQALTNKFVTAYAYGERMEKVVILNPTDTVIKIKKGTPVAEFHPDLDNSYQMFEDRGPRIPCMNAQETKAEEADWRQELEQDKLLKCVDLTETRKRSPSDFEKMAKLLIRYKHLLSDGSLDYVANPTAKHNTTCEIVTTEQNPKILSHMRSSNPEDQRIFMEIVQQKAAEGVIEPSRAPWSSNAVLVKKDGKVRMVIDYRALNKVTVKDAYPMPRIQDITDVLKGTMWFTSLDCVQAFHQIPIVDERSKDLTTFRGPAGGLYRYRYMPMGLCNAMAVWSRFIDSALQKYQNQCVLVYADDCLVYTKSDNVDDHIRDIENVFKQLDAFGVKIKASKLKLGHAEMPFLGVIITKEGIQPNPEKTKAIKDIPPPKTLKQLRSVLGMFAYYRKFIPRFSEIAKPLYEQTRKNAHNKKRSEGHILTKESTIAFEQLKQAVTKEPIILHYPDWNEPFEIHCDASKQGVGAVLTQRIEGNERVIMFASKALNDIERKYQTYEQECLAVVWATELFRKYIGNKKTLVYTDCSALQWLYTKKNEGSRVARWIMRIQGFDLVIRHRKGSKAANVDGMTRDPAQGENPYGEDQIEPLYDKIAEEKEHLYNAMLQHFEQEQAMIIAESEEDPHEKPEKKAKDSGGEPMSFYWKEGDLQANSREAFIVEQTKGSKFMNYVREEMGKSTEKAERTFAKGPDGLIVMKRLKDGNSRVVVPETLRAYVIHMHHNTQLAGHQGRKRTVHQIRQTFYWEGMRGDIDRWIRSCMACRRRKTPRPLRAGITTPRQATYPNEVLAIDIFGPMHKSTENHLWIITMMDQFTRWPVAIPIKDRTSDSVANAIFTHWICEKGVPARIISDRGKELISESIKRLCSKLGITKVATGGYNPTGNSTVERFHRYLGASMCIVYEKRIANWQEYLPPILFSYRASVNDSTGFTPFLLEHGREPQLPLQSLFPFMQRSEEATDDYVSKSISRLTEAFRKAQTLQFETSQRNHRRKDKAQYQPDFEPGDWLMVWERASAEARLRGSDDKTSVLPTKLQDTYQGPFKMIRWNGDRECVIDRDGAEVAYNVNRLIKQHTWDGNIIDTSKFMERPQEDPAPATIRRDEARIGQIIIFPLKPTAKHIAPFGVGELLDTNPKGYHFQWRGNYSYKPTGRFTRGFYNPSDGIGYYRQKPEYKTHLEWTGISTGETPKRETDLIARGADLLDKNDYLTLKAKRIIDKETREYNVDWKKGRVTEVKM